jgi:putative mRNA 3-end processing factor
VIAETPQGLYCEAGGFYVDPWQPVERAVITHAHADHASAGSASYLCAAAGAELLRRRLPGAVIETLDYGTPLTIGGVRLSFHPAGHILGSAQIRLERGGDVWVISGDYKRTADPTCAPFEPVQCRTFVSEATFGLPIYTWDDPGTIVTGIVDWWSAMREAGRSCVLFCYVLGKAQRILALLRPYASSPIHIHGAVEVMTDAYRNMGVELAETERITDSMRGKALAGALVLAPLSARGTVWMRRLPQPSTAFASGLMRVRGVRRQRGFDRGFVLSDHADWRGLLNTINETGASRVLVTHGWSDALARYLAERGLETGRLRTAFEGEAGEFAAASTDDAGGGAPESDG